MICPHCHRKVKINSKARNGVGRVRVCDYCGGKFRLKYNYAKLFGAILLGILLCGGLANVMNEKALVIIFMLSMLVGVIISSKTVKA